MKGTKIEIIDYLKRQKDNQEWIIQKIESKQWRTLTQNCTYYMIFWAIWNKLWYDKEVVKRNILTALFWTYECTMFWDIHLVPNKLRTRDLDKKEAIRLIDSSLEYAKKIWAWIEITGAEIRSLYDSYNN